MRAAYQIAIGSGIVVGVLWGLKRSLEASGVDVERQLEKAGIDVAAWTKGPPYYYKPGSDAQIALFQQAAVVAGVPAAWASDPDFIKIYGEEDGGWVGRPNYEFGKVANTSHADEWPALWADWRANLWPAVKSHATGLGQVQPDNIKAYYPQGLAGIGDPLNEAVGMLRYIKHRYGDPTKAQAFHVVHGWY